jgi:hypothetical protein
LGVGGDGTLTVPVNIDDPHPAGSSGLTQAQLALTYDPAALSVSVADIHLGTVPSTGNGWDLQATVDQITGQIGVTLFSVTPIRSSTGGSLVTIDFHTRGTEDGTPSIHLAAAVTPEGRGVIRTTLADDQGLLTLHAALTNAVTTPGPVPEAGVTAVGLGTEAGDTGSLMQGTATNMDREAVHPMVGNTLPSAGMLQGGRSSEETEVSGAAVLDPLSQFLLLGNVPPAAPEASANPRSLMNMVAPDGTAPLDGLLVSENPATRLLDQVFLTLGSHENGAAGQPFADGVLDDSSNGALLELFSGRWLASEE